MSTPNPNPSASDPVGSPTASERPDWAPEKFWDPEAKSLKIEDLAKAYGGLEQKLGQGKSAWESERLAKRPESADKYDIKIDGYDPETLAKHPLNGVVRDVAFEMGVSPDEIGPFAQRFVDALTSNLPKPEEELAKLGENARGRLQALDGFVTQTFTDPEERQAVELIAHSAAGVRALEKLMAAAGGKPLGKVPDESGQGSEQNGRKTKAEIDGMMQDPRYWHPTKRDPAFVREVEDWFKAGA